MFARRKFSRFAIFSVAANPEPSIPKAEFLICFAAADPIRECLPVWIVLGFKLPPTGVERVPTGFWRQRVVQKDAAERIARGHDVGDRLEVAPRFLLGPGGVTRRELGQLEGMIRFFVARIAAGVGRPFLQKDGLDPRLEKSVVQSG